jgi:hypothetical protein
MRESRAGGAPLSFSTSSVSTLGRHLETKHKIKVPSGAPTTNSQPTLKEAQQPLLTRHVATPVRFLLSFVHFYFLSFFVSACSFACPCYSRDLRTPWRSDLLLMGGR